MAYADQDDIEGEFKNADFGAVGSIITPTNISEWIAQEEAVLNGRLGTKYTVPITGTSSLLIVNKISILLVCKRIRNKMTLKGMDPGKNQDGIEDERKYANELIDQIIAGTLLLSDASLKTTANGVRSYNVDNDVTPLFDVETDQW